MEKKTDLRAPVSQKAHIVSTDKPNGIGGTVTIEINDEKDQ